MRTMKLWKGTARWLLKKTEPLKVETAGCSVVGCQERPILAVAGNESRTTFMCVRHALAWSSSDFCENVAQHNSYGSPAALTAWLVTNQAGA
jgi:hypothetical protein